ncbi:TetR/AcrR family transcriptional regulator [Alteromonadaceae bacterium BrNp21-10]|nr:TetR/AcrR family transcriptional regulator [Alteromonadaceae bacterium BrNp21-10]
MDNNRHNLKFKGRIAKRKDSKLRRDAILTAALKIIVRDGIRDVRHRAVAKEANVPLSATTYYFDDIHDLVHDAFLFYIEQNYSEVDFLEQQAFEALNAFKQSHNVEQLKQSLKQFLMSHIESQINNREARIVEWSFRQQALKDDKLAAAFYSPQKMMLNTLEAFFTAFNPQETQAMAKAHITMGTLLQLEYQLLLSEYSKMTMHDTLAVIEVMLDGPLFS